MIVAAGLAGFAIVGGTAALWFWAIWRYQLGGNVDKLKRLFVGIATDPQLVAAFRALVLYGLPLGTAFVIGLLNGVTDPKWVGLALAAAAFIRVLEGAIDRALKATQNDQYPRPPAGATPPDPPRPGIV